MQHRPSQEACEHVRTHSNQISEEQHKGTEMETAGGAAFAITSQEGVDGSREKGMRLASVEHNSRAVMGMYASGGALWQDDWEFQGNFHQMNHMIGLCAITDIYHQGSKETHHVCDDNSETLARSSLDLTKVQRCGRLKIKNNPIRHWQLRYVDVADNSKKVRWHEWHQERQLHEQQNVAHEVKENRDARKCRVNWTH